MAVVPFRWLGRQRSEALIELLNQRLGAWFADWAPASHATGLDAVPGMGGAGQEPVGRWYCFDLASGRLALHLKDGAQARLGAWLAGAAVSGDEGLATGVGTRALLDLARVLTGQTHGEIVGGPALSNEAIEPRRGGLVVAGKLGETRVLMYLDAPACDALVPPHRASTVPLVPIAEALGNTEARLSVVLDLGKAALTDVSELKPGMILRTRVPVSSALQLVAPDGKVICAGPLSALDGRRAIRIK